MRHDSSWIEQISSLHALEQLGSTIPYEIFSKVRYPVSEVYKSSVLEFTRSTRINTHDRETEQKKPEKSRETENRI